MTGTTRGFVVDTHAHVFTNQLPTVANTRYVVSYSATNNMYVEMLHNEGAHYGVLVQPSFLGNDNSFLLGAIAEHPTRFKGIAMVAPSTPLENLRKLSAEGIAGVRLNLVGKPDPDFSNPELQHLFKNIKELNWQVEIHAESSRLPIILPGLLDAGVKIVVDHFGKVSEPKGVDCDGFKYLLSTAKTGRVWVKISAWYRLSKSHVVALKLAKEATKDLLLHFGPQRLVYGSDWPHTQHENYPSVDTCRVIFDELVPNASDREIILTSTPIQLFGFQSS